MPGVLYTGQSSLYTLVATAPIPSAFDSPAIALLAHLYNILA
jgi:hypothetical protein